jgi:hypothetical protein
MTTLAAPTLFPIPPDGAFPITLSRAWLTDVQRTRSGKEVRLALRSRPARRLEYKSTLAESVEINQFLVLWLAAVELLRFDVPVWPEDTDATAFPDDHTITCDTTDREFIEGEQAIIWIDETTSELVTIDQVFDDHITTVDMIVGDWAASLPAPILVAPVMTAWLVPPPREQRTPVVEHVALVFDEELPCVAGLDSSAGEPVTPAAASISLVLDDGGDPPDAGFKRATFTAVALDASGQRIPSPLIIWTVTSLGFVSLDPPTRVTFPANGQQVHLEFESGAGPDIHIVATYGAISASTDF